MKLKNLQQVKVYMQRQTFLVRNKASRLLRDALLHKEGLFYDCQTNPDQIPTQKTYAPEACRQPTSLEISCIELACALQEKAI